MTSRIFVIVSLLCASRIIASEAADDLGVIRGVVVNESRNPVAGATVFIETAPVLGMVAEGSLRAANTDDTGQYMFDRLKSGTYRVYAMKESEGYPNPSFDFWGNGLIASAQVSHESTTLDVLLVIGPKAGSISGSISDSDTGKPIQASIRLWRTRNPEHYVAMSIESKYNVLVPPNAEIDFEVKAQGYHTWRYLQDGPSRDRKSLALRSAEQLAVDCRLQREGEKQ